MHLESPQEFVWKKQAKDTWSYDFMAWLPPAVLVGKTKNFAVLGQARVCDVAPTSVTFEMGRRSLVPWTLRWDTFPLSLAIQLKPESICKNAMTHFVATLKPLVSGVQEKDQTRRAAFLAQLIQHAFLAQDVERRFAVRTTGSFPVRLWSPGSEGKRSTKPAPQNTRGMNYSVTGLCVHMEQVPVSRDLLVEFHPPGVACTRTRKAKIVYSNPQPHRYTLGLQLGEARNTWLSPIEGLSREPAHG